MEVKSKRLGMPQIQSAIEKIASENEPVDVPRGHVVKDGVVYELCFGGPNRVVGYVKDGVPYRSVIGGPDRVISPFRFG